MSRKSPVDQLTVDARRRLAAGIYLRESLTLEQLALRLATLTTPDGQAVIGGANPETEQPWSCDTLSRDLKALKKQWRDDAKAEIDTHTTRILAELQEVKREAWARGRLTQVLMAIDREMKLLGIGQGGDERPDPLENVQYASRAEFERAMREQYARNMGLDRKLKVN